MARTTTVSTYTNTDPYETKTELQLEASFELGALHIIDISSVTLNAKKLDGKMVFELQEKIDEALRATINEYFRGRKNP